MCLQCTVPFSPSSSFFWALFFLVDGEEGSWQEASKVVINDACQRSQTTTFLHVAAAAARTDPGLSGSRRDYRKKERKRGICPRRKFVPERRPLFFFLPSSSLGSVALTAWFFFPLFFSSSKRRLFLPCPLLLLPPSLGPMMDKYLWTRVTASFPPAASYSLLFVYAPPTHPRPSALLHVWPWFGLVEGR